MCVIYLILYSCNHHSFLDKPLVTPCQLMAAASTHAHPVYCESETPVWEIRSDNVCHDCCGAMFMMEKRYAVAQAVHRAGGRTKEMDPISPSGARIWLRWLHDRERYRSIGVCGGKDGELGQGWRKQKIVVPGRDFYREAGKPWMSDRYGPGKMLGWEEKYGFDPFLGEMGEFETREEPKGIQSGLMRANVEQTIDGGLKMRIG